LFAKSLLRNSALLEPAMAKLSSLPYSDGGWVAWLDDPCLAAALIRVLREEEGKEERRTRRARAGEKKC